jgi:serine/threonine protein kinase/Tol biopolymer transport system component
MTDRSDLDRERRLVEVLTQALAVPASGRRAFVKQTCAGDAALADDVLALLAEESALSGFLERPALAGLDEAAEHPPPPAPGQVGSFRLLRPLGEGGMGQVFLAQQTEPVEREVALKLMQPGLSAPAGRARFQAERQALARLSHRNVAQLYESGTTADDRLFFAMEVIDGPPITEYCDRHQLDVDARLRLFVAACMGVQHAHDHGLVHRDLKPSNVLVATVDGEPVPKIIDFGIAQAVDRPLTDKTTLTGRWFPGAPSYTSPEALDDREAPLDFRSDVYSLGVLLYELLTGVRPFDEGGASPVEMLRRIQDVDPTRPSARIARLDPERATAVAAARRSIPAALGRRIDGDLDWIVLRALAKVRDERYQSAAALARDIERHRADQPVEAGPPGRVYRLRKFLRRNRVAAGVAAALIVVVLAGAAGVLFALSRARDAERAAALVRASRALGVPLDPAPLTSETGLFWSPRISPDAQQLVYVRHTGDSADLMLRTLADGRDAPLRASAAHEYSPAWAADGSAVAFLRQQEDRVSSIVVIDIENGTERTIATVAAPPFGAGHLMPPHMEWSPDGAHFVVAERTGDATPYRLSLIDVATGARRHLTDPPPDATGDTSARFSPDGRRLLVTRHLGFNVRELQMYDFDPQRGLIGPPRLVRAADDEPAQNPAWTPDGQYILFTSGVDNRIWFAPAASPSSAQRLPYGVTQIRMPDVRATADGRWLLTFVLNDHDVDIVRVPLTRERGVPRAAPATEWTGIAPSIDIDARPALSPDGRQMAFTSDRTGSLQIWVADLESGTVRQLTRLPPNLLGHLQWSPDGGRIAFVTSFAGPRGRDLFTVRLADGAVEPLVEREADDRSPYWSPDGRHLYFVAGPDNAARPWRIEAAGGTPTMLADRTMRAFRARPGGGYIVVDDGFWFVRGSLTDPPELLTRVTPYDPTSFDLTPRGIYFVTGDRRLVHYGFATGTLTTLASLPRPVRAGVVVSNDERQAFVTLAEERIRLMLVDDVRAIFDGAS